MRVNMAKLLLKFNAAVLREIPLDQQSMTVGRDADNEIVIDNPAISGQVIDEPTVRSNVIRCHAAWRTGAGIVESLRSR